jgi:hypothetical protein
MQAVGIKTALACILFGFSSLGPGGHFAAEFPSKQKSHFYHMDDFG